MKFIRILIFLTSITIVYCQNTADEFYESGLSYQNSKNYKEAIQNFHKALELFAGSDGEQYANTCWYLQLCYYQIGNYKKAIEIIKLWIESGNTSFYFGNAYFNLGTIYENQMEYLLGIEAYTKVLCFINEDWNAIKNSENTRINSFRGIWNCSKNLGKEYAIINNKKLSCYSYYVKLTHDYWQYEQGSNLDCIYSWSTTVQNRSPITISHIEVELTIKDKKENIVYKKSHWIEINLNPDEVIQTGYFDLVNKVCLPKKYVEGGDLLYDSVVKSFAYKW
jgi:tetratricopeptide (TPR) repeat protein